VPADWLPKRKVVKKKVVEKEEGEEEEDNTKIEAAPVQAEGEAAAEATTTTTAGPNEEDVVGGEEEGEKENTSSENSGEAGENKGEEEEEGQEEEGGKQAKASAVEEEGEVEWVDQIPAYQEARRLFVEPEIADPVQFELKWTVSEEVVGHSTTSLVLQSIHDDSVITNIGKTDSPLLLNNFLLLVFPFQDPDEEGLHEFLVVKLGFNPERVASGIKKLKEARGKASQRRMDSFFQVSK